MKKVLLLLFFCKIQAQLYKPSEKYEPIRHDEEERVITDKGTLLYKKIF